MTRTRLASPAAAPGRIPLLLAIPLAGLLTAVFVALLFPWDAVARRLAFEIGAASGARVAFGALGPAWTARGPVLRARDMRIEHPSVQQLDLLVCHVRHLTMCLVVEQ